MADELVQLVFNVPYGPYNSGEVAGFTKEQAARLLDLTATINLKNGRSERGPLVRKYNQPVLDRVGVIKDMGQKIAAKEEPEEPKEDKQEGSKSEIFGRKFGKKRR